MVRLYEAEVMGVAPSTFRNDAGQNVSYYAIFCRVPLVSQGSEGYMGCRVSASVDTYRRNGFKLGDLVQLARTSEKWELVSNGE